MATTVNNLGKTYESIVAGNFCTISPLSFIKSINIALNSLTSDCESLCKEELSDIQLLIYMQAVFIEANEVCKEDF